MKTDFPMPAGIESLTSPSILIDADRVSRNIQMMLSTVGGDTSRLRPHVKTHKMAEVTRMQVESGINKFKVATISEANMIAEHGGRDILLAYQPVGPNVLQYANLIRNYPNVSFATIVDHTDTLSKLANELERSGLSTRVLIDVDCGMHRTGIPLGDALQELRQAINSFQALEYAGLHVYDGHLHQPSAETRQSETEKIINAVREYDQKHPSSTITGGGSPTFNYWAKSTPWECSPGTTLFWDLGYESAFPELPFEIAVTLLTRVISKPGKNRFCIDLGYKSLASEMPLSDRLCLIDMPEAEILSHSEEHMVISSTATSGLQIGQPLLAFPRHVCPTIALHESAAVIREGQITSERWSVTARNRQRA